MGMGKYMKGLIDKTRKKVEDKVQKYSPYKQVNEALGGKIPSKPEIRPPSLTPANKRKKIKPKK